jgi:cell division septation protein DedD
VAVAPTPPAPAPAPKAAPPPTNPGGGIRVQLGAFADQSQAEKAWIKIKSANSDLLGGASPNVSEFTPDGKKPVYRLQAGPFADLGSARNACVELKARKVDCIVRP